MAVVGSEVALAAVEVILLHVHALVPLQVSQRVARERTEFAFVRLLACVRAHVPLQVDQLGGGVGALLAAVRLLAVVCFHVPLQVIGVTRAEAAQFTGVRFTRASVGHGSASVPLPLLGVCGVGLL